MLLYDNPDQLVCICVSVYQQQPQQDLAKFFCGFQPWRAQDMANAASPKVTD